MIRRFCDICGCELTIDYNWAIAPVKHILYSKVGGRTLKITAKIDVSYEDNAKDICSGCFEEAVRNGKAVRGTGDKKVVKYGC